MWEKINWPVVFQWQKWRSLKLRWAATFCCFTFSWILLSTIHIKSHKRHPHINNTEMTFRLNTKMWSFGRKHSEKTMCSIQRRIQYLACLACHTLHFHGPMNWTFTSGVLHIHLCWHPIKPHRCADMHRAVWTGTARLETQQLLITAWRWSFTGRVVQYFGSFLII